MSAVTEIKHTAAQQQACAWLLDHNSEGMWTHDGTLLAAGEVAPIMRQTWNALRLTGCVTFERGTRVALTQRGRELAELREFNPGHYSNFNWDEDGFS